MCSLEWLATIETCYGQDVIVKVRLWVAAKLQIIWAICSSIVHSPTPPPPPPAPPNAPPPQPLHCGAGSLRPAGTQTQVFNRDLQACTNFPFPMGMAKSRSLSLSLSLSRSLSLTSKELKAVPQPGATVFPPFPNKMSIANSSSI